MRLFPYITGFLAGYLGWRVGKLVDPFLGFMLAILGGSLAFYYARRYQKELMP